MSKKIDEEEAINLIYKGWLSFFDLPDELKANKNVVFAAVDKKAGIFKYIADEFKNDKDIVLLVVEHYGALLQFASDKLRGDKEVVLTAIKNDSWAFKYVCGDLRKNKKIALGLVKKNCRIYKYFDVCLQKDIDVINLANKKMKEYNKNVNDYLCDELKELKKKYGVNTLEVALEMEVAEIDVGNLLSVSNKVCASNASVKRL